MTSTTYDLTEDDLVQFSMQTLRAPGPARRQLRLGIGALLMVCVGLLVSVGWILRPTSGFMTFVGVVCLLFATFMPSVMWWRIEQLMRRKMSHSPNRALVGANTLTIDDGGVHRTHDVSSSSVGWAGVERLWALPDYLSVFITSGQAYVVPRRAFATPEREAEFRAELERRSGKTFA